MLSFSVTSNPKTSHNLWQWQEWEGLPYLTCNLLKDWQHGFFTQQFVGRSPQELVQVFAQKIPAYRLKQVHGNQVLIPTEINQALETSYSEDPLNFPDGDGIITDSTNQSVWVASADCTPVLIGDLTTGRVSAIHAGWRGTAKRIVPEAIERFLDFGSSLENLRIALGPAISGEVYQVTTEVATQVGASLNILQKENTSAEIISYLYELGSKSPLIKDSEPDKVRLNIRQVILLQLEELGISSEQIAIAPYCTYQQPEYFFSYRRTQNKKIQWSGIIN